MQQSYYIDTGGAKDGPYDMVSIMRRIRAHKIGPDTGIFVGEDPTPLAANQISEIAFFFDHRKPVSEPVAVPVAPRRLSLGKLLADGWQFTIEHNAMTVYAGGLLLLALMVAITLGSVIGFALGGTLGWMSFMIMSNIYVIFVLRLFRGQTFSPEFINRQLAPALPRAIGASILLALMLEGGLFLLIIPYMIVAVLYLFVPLLILDRRFKIVEAMHASRLLINKQNGRYVGLATILVSLELLSFLLILPVPLTLPLLSAALCGLYEELSAL